MFGLSNRCEVNQFIAKKNFLNYGNLSKVEKDELVQNVSKIVLAYQISPTNSNIPSYSDTIREYTLINIFIVDIEKGANIRRIATFIMNSMPYPAVIIFNNNEYFQIILAHQRTNQNDSTKNILEDFIISEEIENDYSNFLDISNMNLSNLYTLYSDMIDSIIIKNAQALAQSQVEPISSEQAKELLQKVEQLSTEITLLKAQFKKETQFNRKVELNIKIKKLEKEINQTKGE